MTGINLVIMPPDGYLECEVRVNTQEKTAGKERKRRKKKEERRKKKGRQSVVFRGNKR